MIGQGSPRASFWPSPRFYQLAVCWGCRLVLAVGLAGALCDSGSAETETYRLRLAWGGGAERLWQGKIAISDGQLAEPAPLGIEADEVG